MSPPAAFGLPIVPRALALVLAVAASLARLVPAGGRVTGAARE
jgi:hypothetical protein